MTKRTPRPRRDGRCYVCRKPYEIHPRSGVPPAIYIDPFCSSVCAKTYFGTEDASMPKKKIA